MSRIKTLVLSSVAFLALSSSLPARSAILLEEGGRSVRKNSFEKTADSGLALRRLRRVGVGGSVMGSLGLGGANLELCFTPESSFVGGYGGGPGYNSFTLQFKRVLGGENFLTYFSGGYSRWYSVGEAHAMTGGSSTPSVLADQFLSPEERRNGRFAVDLIHPAIGFQALESTGSWAGSSVYVELMALMAVEKFVAAPTASLGLMYYF